MEPSISQFHFYSFGIAAENKHLDTEILHVHPIEITFFSDGELDTRLEDYVASGTDKDEKEYTVKVKQDSAVEASWLRFGHTHRRTPPDIRRGERIMLYRFGDSERLFWDCAGMDDHLRRLESVIWTFSDTTDESKDATDPKNCYSVEVCTHTKQVTLRTMKENKEPFAYVFQFNTKEGRVVLSDDDENYIELDSKETRILLKNKDMSVVHLDKKRVFINGDEEVRIKSGATEVIFTPTGTTHYTPLFHGLMNPADSMFKGIKGGDVSPLVPIG